MSNFPDEWKPLFPDLSADEASSERIMNEAYRVELPARQAVFMSGAQCESYLLLLSGSVRVQVIGEEGREALLYRVLPGQSCVLTTCCMLANDSYPAEGHTEEKVTALSIPRSAFEETLARSAAFRRFVFANLGARIAEVIMRIETLTFQSIERRLAEYLLAKSTDDNCIQLTHQQIAVELGSVREVVSRKLKRLETQGVLRLGRSVIEVLDSDGLSRLISPVK